MLAKFDDNLRIAFGALAGNKLRTGLTMLGMTIGVASVVLLVSVGQAVEDFIIGEFTSFGSDLIFIFGEENTEVVDTTEFEDASVLFVPLSQEDADALANPLNVPDVLYTAPVTSTFGTVGTDDVRFNDREIAGVTPNYLPAIDFDVAIGRQFTERDQETAARVAILGSEIVYDLFGAAYPIDEEVKLNGVSFRVVGVLARSGNVLDDSTNAVLIPLSTSQQRLSSQRTIDGDYPVTSVVLRARSAESVQGVIDAARATLRETHDLDVDDDDDFQIVSLNQVVDILDTITGLLTAFLGVIAGISLIVGGIGIMNIMLVTVTERTREIGLRKAVGAQRADILLQFLTESVAIAIVGGAIGVGIAWGASALATATVPNLTVDVRVSSILLATLISVSIGAFFGAYPANRAANMVPIDALRYE